MQTLIFVAADRLGATATSAASRAVLRQRQSVAGRTVARRVLELATGHPDWHWHYSEEAKGRPRARLPDGREGPDFSVAHSAGVVCCAVALDGCVGIDVEQVRPGRRYGEMASTFFSVAEQRRVRSDGFQAFLACWVLREAYAKATGAGLSAALSIDGGWVVAARNRVSIVRLRGQPWIIGHRACGDRHLALAWRPSSPDEALRGQADAALETAGRQLADRRAGGCETRKSEGRA